LCRQLGIDDSFSFDFIDHTIVADRRTSEEVFELIKDTVQELITLDMINGAACFKNAIFYYTLNNMYSKW
jgi:hypothetical protein